MPGEIYCSVDELKSELRLKTGENVDAARVKRAIEDACAVIDGALGVPLGAFGGQDATKVFDVFALPSPPPLVAGSSWAERAPSVLAIEPIVTATSVKLDEDGNGSFETTLTAGTQYVLLPQNRAWKDKLVTIGRTLPIGYGRVQIVGSWGMDAAVPFAIRRAALLQAARYYARGDAPLGVVGGEAGMIRLSKGDLDPDAVFILEQAGYKPKAKAA